MTSSAASSADRKRRLRWALAITGSFLIIETVGGIVSGSLALLADAAHMATDVGALVLSYAAMSLAERRTTARHTYGLHRAEILAAFVNAQVLLLVSGYIFYEAYKRFSEPPEIAAGLMLWVAVAGLIANLLAMRLLHQGSETSLNMRAAYLEVLTDMLGSLGVIVAALVMAPTGWYWVDPLVSAGIGFLIVPRTLSLLRESTHVLVEGSPPEIDLGSLRDEVLKLPGVESLHDLHVWSLTSGMHAASVHVRATERASHEAVLAAVKVFLRDRIGVSHATVQVEWAGSDACDVSEHDF